MAVAVSQWCIHRRSSLRLAPAEQLGDLLLQHILQPALNPAASKFLQGSPLGASLALSLTDGVLLGLCSAWAVSSFLPVSRRGLINLEGYIAFSLFPLLSPIPPSLSGGHLNEVSRRASSFPRQHQLDQTA